MSAATAFCPAGTTIGYASTGAPAVFTNVEGVLKIGVSGQKRETDDVTDMQSTSGYHEYIPTLKEGGEVTLDTNFKPGAPGQGGIATLFESGDTVNFKITLPNSRGSRTFAGFVVEAGGLELPVDKKATMPIKIKVTGPPTDVFAS